MSCAYDNLDAAYVLGALSTDERAAFELHLGSCARCSRSVATLAGLPGLLAKVPADVLEPATSEPVPATLLPRLIAAAERSQRRRTLSTALVAAAAVAVIAGGSAALAAGLGGGGDPAPPAATQEHTVTVSPPPVTVSPETAPREPMVAVGDSDASGWVSLTAGEGGTRVDLTCGYAGSHRYTYEIVVRTRSGEVQTAGTLTAVPGQEQHVVGHASVPPGAIVAVEVRNDYGAILRLRR